MQLANPSAFWWLAIALPIAALYLLQRRPRRVPISTRLFWDELLPESSPRRWWQRLRDPLSLLLTLLLLLLLTLAMARPQWSGESFKPCWQLVVLDNSASMQALADPSSTSNAITRFDLAKRHTVRKIEQLREQDQMSILVTAPFPRQIVARTASGRQLRAALADLHPTDAAGINTDAIQLARRMSQEDDLWRTEIHWITDGQPHGSSESNEAADSIDTMPTIEMNDSQETQTTSDADHVNELIVGAPAQNLAITQFQARRPLDDPTGFELYVQVACYGTQAVSGRLELFTRSTLDEAESLIDVVPFELLPNGSWQKTIRGFMPTGGLFVGRLVPSDEALKAGETDAGWRRNRSHALHSSQPHPTRTWPPTLNALSRDDQAYAILPTQLVDVTLVTSGNHYLEQALRSVAWIQLSVLQPNEVVQQQDALNRDGVVLVIDGEQPLEQLFARPTLLIRPGSIEGSFQIGEPLEPAPIAIRQSASDLLQHVSLEGELSRGVRACELLDPSWEPILTAGDRETPVFARGVASQGSRALLLNLDPSEGDLVWRTAFPLLISNSVQWLSGKSGQLQPAYATGETVSRDALGLSRNRAPDIIVSPSGRRLNISDRIGPLDEVGVWKIRSSQAEAAPSPSKMIACNLTHSRESDLRRPVDTLAANRPEPARAELGFGHRSLSFYALLMALLIVLAEWHLVQRRWLS